MVEQKESVIFSVSKGVGTKKIISLLQKTVMGLRPKTIKNLPSRIALPMLGYVCPLSVLWMKYPLSEELNHGLITNKGKQFSHPSTFTGVR